MKYDKKHLADLLEDSEDMSQKRVPLTTWLQEACTGHVSARDMLAQG